MSSIVSPAIRQPHAFEPFRRWVVPVVVGGVLLVVPAPPGLSAGAWHYLALFAAVVAALIVEPIPAAACAVIGLTIAAAFRMVGETASDATKWALSGFANDTVWLIFAAYMFADAYAKTGLGRRIALGLVARMGRHTLGLGYAIALADGILAPFTPSNTARSGGTIFPILANIPPLYGSNPGPTARKIGTYLMTVAFATTCVTSSLFLTALAPNLLALNFAQKITGLQIGWTTWFIGIAPVGLILFLAVPPIVYLLERPEIGSSEEIPVWAKAELAKLGPLTRGESTLALAVIAALGLWIFGSALISPTIVAFAVVAVLLVSNVLGWNDVLANKGAWGVLVWFGALVTLADGLAKVGVLDWLAHGAASHLIGLPLFILLAAAVALFFVVHYGFASLTAQATALYPVLLGVLVLIPGVPKTTAALALAYGLGLMGVLTPYACGPAPIYAHGGYIPNRDFWRTGAILGAVFLVALIGIGLPWMLAVIH
jgi:L-tartrate/succinate antiporter